MTRLIYLAAGYALRTAVCQWHCERYEMAIVAAAVAVGLIVIELKTKGE